MKDTKNKNKVNHAGDNAGKSSEPETHTSSERLKTENQPKEYGGRKDGLDPTRYGDWEKNGRCIDF